MRYRCPQKQHNHHSARQVQRSQQARLGHAPAQPAGGVGTENIEQADQRQHRGAHRRRQMLIHQIRRQVDTDKHHLKAADKKAERQQPEARVRAGLTQRFLEGLLAAQVG